MSSVLNLQEIQEIQTKQRDIAYKTENKLLDIFLPLTGSQNGKLDLTIAYDPDLSLAVSKATSQTAYTITKQESGLLMLDFPEISWINPHESLIYMSFSWSTDHILIQEAVLTNQWTSRWLAIGKLSASTIHGN